jgi:DNA-binding response OmpR family regulator
MLDRDDERTRSDRPRKTRVLLAEDDDPLRDLLASILSLEGHIVTAVPTADAAQRALDGTVFDVIVTDIRMPGTSALEFVGQLRARGHELPIIMMTAFPDEGVREEALSLGTVLVAKPFSLDAMCIAIDWLLRVTSGEKATTWMH